MKRWVLSRGAQASLVDIYAYTRETWGTTQADTYLDGLYATFDRVVDGQEVWRPIPEDFEVSGYFTRYGQHFIYWTCFDDSEIGIVTILHTSMLQGDRLRRVFGVYDAEGSE